MNQLKPDTLRQSEGFEDVHSGLPVVQITVPRERLTTCRSHDTLSEVPPTIFDHLPVEDNSGRFVGLLATRDLDRGSNCKVAERMIPLSEADLIGADATILDLVLRIRSEPFLVVAGEGVVGLVAWSDLQKLPVRTALFALVTGFELTMFEAIKREYRDDDHWLNHLTATRREKVSALFQDRRRQDSHVDLLLCTQFCDKREIIIASFDFSASKRQLKKKTEGHREDQRQSGSCQQLFDDSRSGREAQDHSGGSRRASRGD